MRMRTNTSSSEPVDDRETVVARRLRRVVLFGTIVTAIWLVIEFVFDTWLGLLSRQHSDILWKTVMSFFLLLMAYVTAVQIRHYRRTGQKRIGPFGESRLAWEIWEVAFLLFMGSIMLAIWGVVPAKIAGSIAAVAFAAAIVGFAGMMGSSLGSGLATIGVILSAGGALYKTLVGADQMKAIIHTIIYLGVGLVGVAILIFIVRQRRKEKGNGNGKGVAGK